MPNTPYRCLDFSIYTGMNTAPGDRPWNQGTYGSLTWGKNAGGESINLKTQYEPSCFYNIHFSTASRIFTGNADIFLGHFTCQESIKQKEIKRFTQGLNLKRKP